MTGIALLARSPKCLKLTLSHFTNVAALHLDGACASAVKPLRVTGG